MTGDTTPTGQDIVCVGFADWRTDLWTNQHHLMSRLARRNRVLFVESLGLRRPQLDQRDLSRIQRRLRRTLSGLEAVDDLHVLSPPVVPLHGLRPVRALNARVLPRAVARGTERLGMRTPILWSYAPHADVLIDALRPELVVYHCVDDIARHKGVDAASFRAVERRYAQRADIVLASAPPLAERLRQISDNVIDAPNVADVSFFARAVDAGPIDFALAALPGPRLVFTGAVVETKLDIDLLVELARRRRTWSVVLVGPVGTGDPSTDVSRLDAEPNIHLLGLRPYDELPRVLRGADVGLIPYAPNELTRSVFPMKVYEYLAAGLPVVSTPLPSLAGLEGIAFAGDAAGMVAAVEAALAEPRQARADRRRIAEGHSWEERLREITAAIEQARDRRARR